jgi:hypothetical protein
MTTEARDALAAALHAISDFPVDVEFDEMTADAILAALAERGMTVAPMSQAESLADIRAREAEATPGPWWRHTYGHRDTRSQVRAASKALRRTNATLREATGDPDIESTDLTWVEYEGGSVAMVGNGPRQTENGDFIANAREDIPALLAEVDRLSRQAEAGAALERLSQYDIIHAQHHSTGEWFVAVETWSSGTMLYRELHDGNGPTLALAIAAALGDG